MSDSSKRSLVKTISWRLTGSGATFLVSYMVLGDVSTSSAIAVIQLTTNTILYYFHERLWNAIGWGKS